MAQVHKGRPPTGLPDDEPQPQQPEHSELPEATTDEQPPAAEPATGRRKRRGAKAAAPRPREQTSANAGHASGSGEASGA